MNSGGGPEAEVVYEGPVPSQEEAKKVGLKIFKYADTKDRILMCIGIVAATLAGTAMPLYSQINGSVVSDLTTQPADMLDNMGKMAINMLYVGAGLMVLNAISGYCITYATMRQTSRIKLLYFKALMRQEVGWHDAHPPGELTSRMDGDVKVIQNAMGDNLYHIIQNTGTVLFGYGVAFYNGWELTLLMLAITPIVSGVTIFVGRRLRQASEDARDGYASAGAVALEALDNIKTVQVFGRESYEAERFAAAVVPAVSAGIRKEFLTYMNGGVTNCLLFAMCGAGYWFGAYLIHWERTTLKNVVVVFFSCLMATFSLDRLSPCMSTFLEGAGAATKIFHVIEREPAMDPMGRAIDEEQAGGTEPLPSGDEHTDPNTSSVNSPPAVYAEQQQTTSGATSESAPLLGSNNDKGDKKRTVASRARRPTNKEEYPRTGLTLPGRRFQREIVFKNVRFAYPTRAEDILFTKLNVTIKKGQTVAFSGASGCGKSSIIGLLQRFYDPLEGSVSVDGVDMRDLNLRGWRDCISIVSQEPKLFTGTIMENVRIGRKEATDADVIAACRMAHVHDVIEKLPDKYETLVGTGGSQLSGGQKQRVAIARALIRMPQILILDEATSALDRKSEVEVQAALEDVMFKSRRGGMGGANDDDPLTVVVIAHRLATIQNADIIHYINHDDVQGSWIEESGTYTELMKMNGHFAAMTKKQQPLSMLVSPTSPTAPAPLLNNNTEAENFHGMTADGTTGDLLASEALDAGKLSDTKEKEEDEGQRQSRKDMDRDAAIDAEDEPLYASAIAKSLKETDEEGVASVPSQHMRVLGLCAGDRWAIFVGIVGCIIAGAQYPAQSVVATHVLQVLAEVSFNSDVIHTKMPLWCGLFFAIAGGTLVAHLMMSAFALAGERLTLKLRRILYYSILRQDMSFFDTPGRDGSSLASVLSTDTQLVHGLWGPSIGSQIRLVTTLGAGLGLAFFYSWRLALATLSATPAFAAVFGITTALLRAFGSEDDNALKAEALTNIRTVVSLNLQDEMIGKYAAHVAKLERKQRFNAIIKAVQGGGFGIVMFSNMALLAWYSAKVISEGQNTFLEAMIAQQAVMQGLRGVAEAGMIAGRFKDAAKATKRVFYIIDREPPIAAVPKADMSVHYTEKQNNKSKKSSTAPHSQENERLVTEDAEENAHGAIQSRGVTSIRVDADQRGERLTVASNLEGSPHSSPSFADLARIELKDVKFRYPARPEAPLLRGVQLSMEMPRTYGLMGETGCGKSTVVGLIARFYDPAAGDVSLVVGKDSVSSPQDTTNTAVDSNTADISGGNDALLSLKDVDLASWRRSISLVLQEPSLFSGTIRDNIMYAKPDASQTEVEQAARYAAIHDDIMLMPNGYDTDVGYKGQALSGGQKQRVAIARALIRKPRVLLMDEATSALDNSTESRVEQGIHEACAANKMIVISVAHRLTTIRDSDVIAVMEAGQVVERGSHEELIALGGHYNDRWQLFEMTTERQASSHIISQ